MYVYLFFGFRGIGKISVVKIFVKVINCEYGYDGEFCNECEICKGMMDGFILDVFEIDVVSNNGVEEIWDIWEKVKYVLIVVKYKVYIIDEVYMLLMGVFNVLLKMLEELLKYVIFILVIIELYKLLLMIILWV